jgi:proline iminopeptidase
VIFCNGGPGCDDYLGEVSAMLEDRHQVIRFEPRGCGRSDFDGRYDLQTTLEDLDFIRLQYGISKMLLVGHSAGVDVALAYVLRYADHVQGLIGLAGGRMVNDRDWHSIYKHNLALHGEDYGGKVFIADVDVNPMGNQSWKEFIKQPDLLNRIARIDCPVAFINAGDDIRPNWPTQQLANLIPKAQYHEIEGARHCIWLTHPKELQACLLACIASIPKLNVHDA